MEFLEEGCQFYAFTNLKLGDMAQQIHNNLLEVYGDDACSYDTIVSCICHFKASKDILEDKRWSNHPSTSVNAASVVWAGAILEQDRSTTVVFLSLELGISITSTYTLLLEEMGLRKRYSQWIPHLLTPELKTECANVCKNLLSQFEPNDPKSLSDVITWDECWIPFFVIHHK